MVFVNVHDKILYQQEKNENAVRISLSVLFINFLLKLIILVAVPQLSIGSSCFDSPYGCCNDNITISPSLDRRGCPGR